MHVLRRARTTLAATVAAALLAVGVADAQSIPGLVSGVDVAGHQRPGGAAIDWKSVGTIGGQDFVFVKASEGEGWKNVYYDCLLYTSPSPRDS